MIQSKMRPFPSRIEAALEEIARANQKILENMSSNSIPSTSGDMVCIPSNRYLELLHTEEEYNKITSDEWLDNVLEDPDPDQWVPDKTDEIKPISKVRMSKKSLSNSLNKRIEELSSPENRQKKKS